MKTYAISEQKMYINDDANSEEIVQETVGALRESARHIGKIGNNFSCSELTEIEEGIKALQNSIKLKKL